MKRIILLGAGNHGRDALKKCGKERVAFFCDNDIEKQNTYVQGILVISFEKMKELYFQNYYIVVTPERPDTLICQLEANGIKEYTLYNKFFEHDYISFVNKIEKDNSSKNNLLEDYANQTTDNACFENICEFKNLVQEIVQISRESNITLIHDGIGGESNFYGNLNNLLEYAGIGSDEYDRSYAPLMSHYDCFPLYFPMLNHKSAWVVSGDYYKSRIHRVNPIIPIFTIGSYISYIKGIYSEKEIAQKKKENGKSLLVYMPHGIENIDRKFDKKEFIDEILKIYARKYETIFLCVYWVDVLDPACEYAMSKGIRVVSNGFRFDSRFGKRQKSLLELADAIVCGDIGSFLGFGLKMGLPIGRIGISNNTTIHDIEFQKNPYAISDEYRKYIMDFENIFGIDEKNNREQMQWMNPIQDMTIVRSKEYIRDMFYICKEIWDECSGDLEDYIGAVIRVRQRYYNNGELDKYYILDNAMRG